MANQIFPVIQPEHYPAFQELVAGLPATYDVWNADHVDKLRHATRQGERPTEVVVYPAAFAEFLRQRRMVGSRMALEAFAVEKAAAAG